jgi:hypothetical protein
MMDCALFDLLTKQHCIRSPLDMKYFSIDLLQFDCRFRIESANLRVAVPARVCGPTLLIYMRNTLFSCSWRIRNALAILEKLMSASNCI